MIRLIVGAVLSAVVLFAWGFVFWYSSGIMYRFMHPVTDEAEVTQVLQKNIPESGAYIIPFPEPDAMSGANREKAAALLSSRLKGPIVEIAYRKEGLDPTSPNELVAGFCHYLAASLLAGVLLVLAQPGLQRYLARVLFVTVLGVFACVAIAFARPIWFHHPWPAVLYESGYNAIGWLLAGLVMALVIRPPKAMAQAKTAAILPAGPNDQPAAILRPTPKEKPAAPPIAEVTPPAEPPSP